VVVTPRIQERVLTWLDSGAELAEVHDVSKFVAELALPPWAPLGQVARGAPIALKPYGAPGEEVDCTVMRVRDVVDGEGTGAEALYGGKPVIAVTSPFALADGRSGMHGHGRVYGESRSLAYAHLYLPLRRLFSIRLWSLW